MIELIRQYRPEIAAICRAHEVRRLELIGSAARGDFDPATSDFDFLVEFESARWEGSSARYFGLLFGLEDLLGRKIDLIERSGIRNPRFLAVAERHRELVYDTRSPQAA